MIYSILKFAKMSKNQAGCIMGKNVISEIKAQYEYLSRVEKSVADLILLDPTAFIKYSMAEIAESAGVSQGSINNFAKKFCADGFAALKLQIAACPMEEMPEPFDIINATDSVKSAMELKIKENTAAFHNTLTVNGEQQLEAAVNALLNARRVDIYGVYHSGIVARDLSFQLIRLGIAAYYVEDTLMCSVSASMLGKSDVAIAITSSGRTKEIIDAAKIAKESGATVISLTSNRFSPMAKLSDISLLTSSSGMSVSDKNDEIRLCQHLVFDTVCAILRGKIDMGSRENYYRLSNILNSHSIED